MAVVAADLAEKFRRALRNNQGTRFTSDELRALADLGMLEMILKAEAEEIMATWRKPKMPIQKQPAASEPRVYSPRTLAERWSCSAGLVRQMIARGELKAFKHGREFRISAEEVDRIEVG